MDSVNINCIVMVVDYSSRVLNFHMNHALLSSIQFQLPHVRVTELLQCSYYVNPDNVTLVPYFIGCSIFSS